MNRTAAARYEEAAEAGSALAYGNLAHCFLDIGASKHAEQAITSGAAIDPNEGRVLAARERLAEIRRDEGERAQERRRLAQRSRATFREATWALPKDDLTGTWSRESGESVTLERHTGGFKGRQRMSPSRWP